MREERGEVTREERLCEGGLEGGHEMERESKR